MHRKFEINRTKIKGGCQSGRKVVPHDSKSDLPLVTFLNPTTSFLKNSKKMENLENLGENAEKKTNNLVLQTRYIIQQIRRIYV